MSQHISDREKIVQIRLENTLWYLVKYLNYAQKINNFESGGIVCGTDHANEQVINKPKARIIICGSPSVGTSIASKIAQLEKVVIVPIKSKQPVLGKINYIELR